MEPPAWYQPTRHRLGAVLLRDGQAEAAEAVYREDLRRNPENGWALVGLHEALRQGGKLKETWGVEQRRHRAWARADVKLTTSVL